MMAESKVMKSEDIPATGTATNLAGVYTRLDKIEKKLDNALEFLEWISGALE